MSRQYSLNHVAARVGSFCFKIKDSEDGLVHKLTDALFDKEIFIVALIDTDGKLQTTWYEFNNVIRVLNSGYWIEVPEPMYQVVDGISMVVDSKLPDYAKKLSS